MKIAIYLLNYIKLYRIQYYYIRIYIYKNLKKNAKKKQIVNLNFKLS
jgi:hypothetical protein